MGKAKTGPKVFFNASVILAGLHSPSGGSGKLLSWVKKGRIVGLASEIIIDEVNRHAAKLGISGKTEDLLEKNGFRVFPAPRKKLVKSCFLLTIDPGDAHVLASAKQLRADFLVSLDKKHILVLRSRLKNLQIIPPGELIGKLS